MTNHKAEQLVSRLSPRLGADVHDDVRIAFGIADAVRLKVAGIVADKQLSVEGHRSQIKSMLGKGPLAHHAQIVAKLKKPLEALQAERATFSLKADKSDSVTEMLRAECRALLRGMPQSERIRLAVETTESLIREAIAMAPAPLSGLPANVRETVFNSVMEERFGVQLANNTHLLDAYQTALIAVEEAGNDIRRETNLSEREFAEVRAAA